MFPDLSTSGTRATAFEASRRPGARENGHVPDRYLSPDQAARTYDRIGRLQDIQIYERRAIRELVTHADFEHAHSVFELGPGTGRLAARLLERCLPETAIYLGMDVSPRMARLASRRLECWRGRANVRRSDGSMTIPASDGDFDRFLCTYVLDLLSPEDTTAVLAEAWRVLEPGGLLCVASLTHGETAPSRILTGLWQRLWNLRPQLVGGCRPISVSGRLSPELWAIRHRAVVGSLALSSEVVVASRLSGRSSPGTR
jgi:ubiquinone/menaquinone biosynthesis C-methylase UbiE